MQRSDGMYDLPDATVSLVWQRESGFVIRWTNRHGAWVSLEGIVHVPQPGRWMPWTPPVFPVRKKMPFRLALVRIGTHEQQAVRSEKHGYAWTYVAHGSEWRCVNDSDVVVLKWLTPEFEDEVGHEGI